LSRRTHDRPSTKILRATLTKVRSAMSNAVPPITQRPLPGLGAFQAGDSPYGFSVGAEDRDADDGRPMSEQLIEDLAGNRVRNVAHHKTVSRSKDDDCQLST
jgi:hypothetical protein